MKGISYFLEDLSEFKHKLGNSESYSLAPESQSKGLDVQATDPQISRPRGRQNQQSSPASPALSSTSPSRDEEPKGEENAIPAQPRFSVDSKSRGKGGPEPSENNIRRIFIQASQLLCEQAKATGCIFVDAASGVFAGPTDQGSLPPHSVEPVAGAELEFDMGKGEHVDTKSDRDEQPVSDRQHANVRDASSDMAQVLSIELMNDDDTAFLQDIVRRKNLKRCIQRYPFGKCFYLSRGRVVADQSLQLDEASTEAGTDDGMPAPASQSEKSLPPEVLARIPNAKWLIFLPLFNYAHSQWFAAGFIWGNDFAMGDPDEVLPYFKTFGSCMMSEVASMEVLNTNIAKSTFIASVSHDLRSPLHGMLGSLEFLEETMTSAYQMSLVSSMETCGKTLLDTIDHLLDYAKINNLHKASTASTPAVGRKPLSTVETTALADQEGSRLTTFDFSILLEEVVEAVFAGQTFRKINLRQFDPVNEASAQIHAMSLNDSAPPEEQIEAGSSKFSGRVCLVFNIEQSSHWHFQGQTGALRRVIMNVVGNAIKYCNSGSIEVSAKVVQLGSNNVEIDFAVKDTGIGMSEDFMANHLFKAFSQEDSFTPGTGLGLSITSQIVENLNGRLKIHSEKGVGTHVHVIIPLKAAPLPSSCEGQERLLDETLEAAEGKKVCIMSSKREDGNQEMPPGKLELSLTSFCEKWFKMRCTRSGMVDDDADTSIFIFAEPPPIEHLVDQHRERMARGKLSRDAALLIVCTNAFEAAALRAAGVDHLVPLGVVIEVISQPVGLRKLAKVVLQCLKGLEKIRADADDAELLGPASPAFPSRDIRQRAAAVPVNLQERPSLEVLRWKSDEPRRKITYIDTSAKGSVSTLGNAPSGSTFELAEADPSDIQPIDDTQEPPHVLLVDDNAINLKLLVTFVKKIKLTYDEATNGLEAFTKFKESDRPFDYVLMDLQMPIMDGFEATRNIRQFEQEKGNVKASTIIAITGVGNENARNEAVEAGMSQYITKPVKFRELQQLLIKK